VAVIDSWGIDAPRTKDAKAALVALGLEGKVLVVLDREDEAVAKSFRNLSEVHALLASELNAYDVLCSDWVVFTRSTLPGVTTDTTTSAVAATSDPAVTEGGRTDPTDRDWDAPFKARPGEES
jgi:ribosomal protein L4